jgi:hypothetical protein
VSVIRLCRSDSQLIGAAVAADLIRIVFGLRWGDVKVREYERGMLARGAGAGAGLGSVFIAQEEWRARRGLWRATGSRSGEERRAERQEREYGSAGTRPRLDLARSRPGDDGTRLRPGRVKRGGTARGKHATRLGWLGGRHIDRTL